MPLHNMTEIRVAARASGSHWFDADSMAFFVTKLYPETVRPISSGALFVTSEQPPQGARMYSVRRAYDNGQIETVGAFCEHATYLEAVRALAEELERQE